MDVAPLQTCHGIDRIGKWHCPQRVKRVLGFLGAATALVVDWPLYRRLTAAGFDLVHRRDNKSEFQPQWLVEGLLRFGGHSPSPPWRRRERSQESLGTGSGGAEAATAVCSVTRESDSASKGRAASPWNGMGQPDYSTRSDNDRGQSAGRREAFRDQRRDLRAVDWTADMGGDRIPSPQLTAFWGAVRITRAAVHRQAGRVEVLPLDEGLDRFVHLNHFSGLPWCINNRDVLPQARDRAARIASGDKSFDPYVAARRIQHGPDGPKGRLVWAAPLSTTLLALRYQRGLQAEVERKRPFALGFWKLEQGSIVSEIQSRFRYVYSLDFSAFDSTIPAWIIDSVFKILAELIDFRTREERNTWDRLINDFVHSRIVFPNLDIYQKHRGVPSGSAFTALVDSIANFLILNYLWIRTTERGLDPDGTLVLGDDSIFGSNAYVPLENLATVAAELGMRLNVQKSQVARLTEAPTFLGHQWKQSRPHRPAREIVIRMAYPERWTPSSEELSNLRLYSYLSDCVEAHQIWDQITRRGSPYITERYQELLANVGGREVRDLKTPPGRLRFLMGVTPEALPSDFSQGYMLAALGLHY